MDELKSFQRRYLIKEAHDLKPVVMIGGKGLTDTVVGAAVESLAANELIKVRFLEFKEDRRELFQALADRAGAHTVKMIGHVGILYKPKENPEDRAYKLPRRK